LAPKVASLTFVGGSNAGKKDEEPAKHIKKLVDRIALRIDDSSVGLRRLNSPLVVAAQWFREFAEWPV
jgi:hypothetical protein